MMRARDSLLRSLLLTAAITAAVPVLIFLLGSHGVQAQVSGQSRVQIGYAIAPVPLNVEGKNRSLVGLGSYIVNAQSGCNSCHVGTTSDNAGLYMAGGAFFGSIGPTPNLTPDDSGLPNGLTLQQFFDIMRNGVDPDGNPIDPIMPWEMYRNMTDRDLTAIYEFLWSIPTQPGPR
jgi:hypothetical protein